MTSSTNHNAITQPTTLPFSYLQVVPEFLFGFNYVSRVVLDNLTKTHLVKSIRAGTHNVECMWHHSPYENFTFTANDSDDLI